MTKLFCVVHVILHARGFIFKTKSILAYDKPGIRKSQSMDDADNSEGTGEEPKVFKLPSETDIQECGESEGVDVSDIYVKVPTKPGVLENTTRYVIFRDHCRLEDTQVLPT